MRSSVFKFQIILKILLIILHLCTVITCFLLNFNAINEHLISIFLFKEWKEGYILLLFGFGEEALYYEAGFLLNTHRKLLPISQLVQKESEIFNRCHSNDNQYQDFHYICLIHEYILQIIHIPATIFVKLQKTLFSIKFRLLRINYKCNSHQLTKLPSYISTNSVKRNFTKFHNEIQR